MVSALVVVLVTAASMVLDDAEWQFSQFWVLLALGLFALASLIGGAYVGRIAVAMEQAANGHDGASSQDATALLNRWLIANGLVLAVLVVAVWDMIFKPGM